MNSSVLERLRRMVGTRLEFSKTCRFLREEFRFQRMPEGKDRDGRRVMLRVRRIRMRMMMRVRKEGEAQYLREETGRIPEASSADFIKASR